MEIIFEKSKLKVVDFSINSVNGGSILLAACKKDFKCDIRCWEINTLREEEKYFLILMFTKDLLKELKNINLNCLNF